MLESLTSESKGEPDGKSFENAENSRRIVYLIQSHFETSIAKAMGSNQQMLKEVMAAKNDWFKTVERKSNAIVQKQIDNVLAWLGQLLAKQKKTDYRPVDDAAAIVSPASEVRCPLASLSRSYPNVNPSTVDLPAVCQLPGQD